MWEIVDAASPLLGPAYEELRRQAAQGELLYNDDTTVKILKLMGERAKAILTDEKDPVGPDRTGLFLRLHQKHSEPAMKSLREWLDQQVAEKLVEPNSGLGA